MKTLSTSVSQSKLRVTAENSFNFLVRIRSAVAVMSTAAGEAWLKSIGILDVVPKPTNLENVQRYKVSSPIDLKEIAKRLGKPSKVKDPSTRSGLIYTFVIPGKGLMKVYTHYNEVSIVDGNSFPLCSEKDLKDFVTKLIPGLKWKVFSYSLQGAGKPSFVDAQAAADPSGLILKALERFSLKEVKGALNEQRYTFEHPKFGLIQVSTPKPGGRPFKPTITVFNTR